ncbi:hypothetical protein BJY01DRAFT_240961 [Aspergillus pseudoustus]|uniref:NAD(P)-binding protein n=1 Tax=Aspergillus pseudoustus TaxID=1810923 RepID=A0ABR4IKN2_9EURO
MPPKTVLITGCSEGGIGDALCKEFFRQGLRVFATARNTAKMENLKALGIETIPLDVVDKASVSEAVEAVQVATGGGKGRWTTLSTTRGYSMPLLDANIDVARDMFDVNVFAVISAPWPFQGFYNASKAVVNLLTDQLRVELEPLHVKVILVVTGTVRTQFFQNLPETRLPPGSVYAPAHEEVGYMLSGKRSQSAAMDVHDYARKVAQNVLKLRPTVNQWIGGSVSAVWAVSTFLWHTAWLNPKGRYYIPASQTEQAGQS